MILGWTIRDEGRRYPIGGSEDTDGPGVSDGSYEFRTGDVGAEGSLHDAVIEAEYAFPPHRNQRASENGKHERRRDIVSSY